MGNTVSGHFGHCDNFNLYDADGGVITAEESIPNPGHRPGFLPNFLADKGVQVIIAGGMGGGAVEIFNERGVEVIVGATGDSRTAVEALSLIHILSHRKSNPRASNFQIILRQISSYAVRRNGAARLRPDIR